MTAAEIARALRMASLDLPQDHEDQHAIQAAHDALMRAPSISGPKVVAFRRPDHQPEPPRAA